MAKNLSEMKLTDPDLSAFDLAALYIKRASDLLSKEFNKLPEGRSKDNAADAIERLRGTQTVLNQER